MDGRTVDGQAGSGVGIYVWLRLYVCMQHNETMPLNNDKSIQRKGIIHAFRVRLEAQNKAVNPVQTQSKQGGWERMNKLFSFFYILSQIVIARDWGVLHPEFS